MSSLFQHFTFGFQQVSKLFHDFTTRSYQIQTYANILPLFSKQLHNLFQHFHWFAIIVPHISAPYRGCSSIFSTPRIGFHQFFSSVLCLINFHHCVIVFHFLCSSIFMSSSPVILLALSLRGLYSDICCHQCWSFVIVLFLGFIIFHIYI